jgi:DHA2 family multidrug resistance protein
VVGRLGRRLDARMAVLIGLALSSLSLWQMSKFTLDAGDSQIITVGLLQGLGSGMVFAPLITVMFATLEPRLRAEGTSMLSLVRNVAVAIGVSVDATVLAQNLQINHAELSPHITLFNRALQFLPPSVTADSVFGAAVLENEVARQAGMIAYSTLFRLSAYLMVVAALIVVFVRLNKTAVPDKPVSVEL